MAEFSKSSSEEPAPKPEEIKPVGELAPPEPEGESPAQPEASEEPEAETVVKLSEPSKELATRVLGKVSFQERLIGTRMHSMVGNISESFYSFKEAAGFMYVDVVGGLVVRGSGSIRYINPEKLQKWVGEVFGDKELAEAIGEKIKEVSSYKERVRLIKGLMQQRLKQCEEIVGEETET